MAGERPRSRPASRVRTALRAALLIACTAAGGCRFLADEFTWLDRADPVAARAPDAPPAGDAAPR